MMGDTYTWGPLFLQLYSDTEGIVSYANAGWVQILCMCARADNPTDNFSE